MSIGGVIRPLAVAVAALAGGSATAEARPFQIGFYDPAFASPDAQTRATWLDLSKGSGARIVRIPLTWRTVAPTRPSAQADPADPAYDWRAVDAAVADATARGLQVLLTLQTAPAWAEGARRPRRTRPGAWKPNPAALGRFATAAALHYSGGGPAPRVRHWQIWNEPNLAVYLAPQWVRSGRSHRTFAPGHYRRMLNAGYAAVKGVAADNVVVTSGTAPYGDPGRGGARIMPAHFWRHVLRRKTRFDVLAHHPYSVGGPRRRALNRDDVSVPDVHKLVRLTRAAERRGTALPRKRKRFWVTEMSWDSAPPDPNGVPAQRHATWLADSFAILWRQGVEAITWYRVGDERPVPSYDSTYQSGIFRHDGTPKPAQRAFAFPFSCDRPGRRGRVWGFAPARGTVTLTSGTRTLKRVRTDSAGVFTARLPAGTRSVRATSGDVISRTCRVR